MVIRKPCYFYVRSTIDILLCLLGISPFQECGTRLDKRSIKHFGFLRGLEVRDRLATSHASGLLEVVFIEISYKTFWRSNSKKDNWIIILVIQFISQHWSNFYQNLGQWTWRDKHGCKMSKIRVISSLSMQEWIEILFCQVQGKPGRALSISGGDG